MSHSDNPARKNSPAAALARDLIDKIDEILQSAVASGQPLELDPQRGRLFELFVMADAAGFLEEDAEHDLSCDGIARELAGRWDLKRNLGDSLPPPDTLQPTQLRSLRLLWSFMRMWMEWTYAWQRWNEFHKSGSPVGSFQATSPGG